MREIIGNTTATPNPRPDWAQTDETKADYIKNKPIVDQVYSAEEKNKLSNIENGAQVNVQSDWSQTDVTKADYIKNKPDIESGEGLKSITQGYDTTADADFADASGQSTKSHAHHGHAGGFETTNNSPYGFTHGCGLNTSPERDAQTAFGTWNEENPDALLQVGNGEDENTKSNAFQVLKDGRAKVQSPPVEDDDVVRFKELLSSIANIDKLTYKVVDALPTEGAENTIYLVPNEKQIDKNIKDEYLWLNGVWELIGSTAVDLSEYTKDVQIEGSSIVEDGVATIPIANGANLGVVREKTTGSQYSGIKINESGEVVLATPANAASTAWKKPQSYGFAVTSKDLYHWMEVGLTQNDRVLTDEQKATAQTWIGVDDTIETKVNKSGDTVTGILNIEGALTLPNSPDNPETAQVTDRFNSRTTANADNTGLTVVDGSVSVVNKIQGDTVKSENLFNIDKGIDGSKLVKNNDGSYTLDTSVRTGNIYKSFSCYLPSGTYTFSFSNISTKIDFSIAIENEQNQFFSLTKNELSKSIKATNPITNISLQCSDKENGYIATFTQPMINIGSNALPYQPYFTGLKNAKISSIKSTGRNLIPFPYNGVKGIGYTTTENGITWTVNADRSVSAKGTATANVYYQLCRNDFGDKSCYVETTVNGFYFKDCFYEASDGKTFILVRSGETVDKRFYPMINYGTTALPYEPYVESVMTLPETELGKWDYIQDNKLVKQTVQIDFDTEEKISQWNIVETTHPYFSYKVGEVGSVIAGEIVCNKYEKATIGVANINVGVDIVNSTAYGEARIVLRPSNIMTLDEFKQYLRDNLLSVVYKTAETISITDIDFDNQYTVWDKGQEIVVGNENAKFGALPTITQEYSIHENPNEAAKKAYVNNGLAKKLDKTGGTITGSLIVEKGTDTTLSALVVKNGNVAYGLTYDSEDEAYKLGQGSVDEKGDFSFTAGEGAPIALRDDSTKFNNGELVMWDAAGNKFVSTGITLATLKEKLGL